MTEQQKQLCEAVSQAVEGHSAIEVLAALISLIVALVRVKRLRREAVLSTVATALGLPDPASKAN